jgi:hypothetical protein
LIDTTKEEKKKRGRTSRAAGKRFEILTRRDLETKGYIVCKWGNNIEFDETGEGKLIIAKSKYNPFLKRVMNEGSGFPDYIVFKRDKEYPSLFNIIGVESKMNGILDKIEKKKIEWLKSSKVFSRILLACKNKNKRGSILYKEL